MPPDAIGLDIGGANLKAATASGRARSRPFALWKHPERLADELLTVTLDLRGPGPVSVTMTGELCDCFETKREGVRHILGAVVQAFPGEQVAVWSTAGRFMTVGEAAAEPTAVAAANWHALATVVGRFAADGLTLLIDVGSTTTDVIPILDGQPVPAGRTDPQRLRANELVYTGIRRTPVCAVAGSGVAAELFATTLDVYLRLGMVPERRDDRDTADGRPATDLHAHARLARMFGGDAETTADAETRMLARRVFERQVGMIHDAVSEVCLRMARAPETVFVSGSGEFLARAALESLSAKLAPNRVIPLSELFGSVLSESACAYAVARLATEERIWER